MAPDRLDRLRIAFGAADAPLHVGFHHVSAIKGDRFARYTTHGWLLFRPGLNGEERFFAEGCSDDLALAFIETGDIRTTH
jgi:hypothetical protein